ncbi:scavenger receptor class F member 1 [Nelusetta ayraudi]|uniref:scavenger receptor class F member 1 n=1 Tax=Nelusetta ayraudi TaxID=303726 RepID=UPI003F6FBC59
MNLLLGALSALLSCSWSSSKLLDPAGKNVCRSVSDPSTLVCCPGWRQDGGDCPEPVCEGEQACLEGEICVYPGVCHCPAGFYGAQCKTSCPPDFWAPNCRKVCPCHPHGRCDPLTGECTCNANRWGPLCQYTCKCGWHGRCHPVHGNCSCEEGWWTSTCSKRCQCVAAGSVGLGCDQLTGRCACRRDHWGVTCRTACNCHVSGCSARTGLCECEPGWWGKGCGVRCNCDLTHGGCDPDSGACLCHPGYGGTFCNIGCKNGTYGSGCGLKCGFCKDGQVCSRTDGACDGCRPGYNGTQCNRRCLAGYYGDGCREKCARCRNNEPCDHKTGKCSRCDPGWTGPRCEAACSNRTFGDGCRFLCGPCFHGDCHHVTGRCVCQPGFQGESCNSTCAALHFGLNCSSTCNCGEGVRCDPVTGVCPGSVKGSVLAGILVPLLLLLLAVLCCCLCCGGSSADAKDRAAVADGGLLVRMKYHVYSVLANISAALPCISNWSSGLPRVTVSHHDPELTFNHSFIEPPSSGWVTEGSSFETDEEEGEALYCVPPREDIEPVAGGEFQEISSKCNMFDPSGFSSEDIASNFNIPRTSSNAKSKRPSVSFAEGTRFSPKERRGSTQDPAAATPAATAVPRSKAKSTWGVLMLSSLQNQGGASRAGEAEDTAEKEREDEEEHAAAPESREESCDPGDQEGDRTPSRATLQVPGASGRRRTMSNTAHHKANQPSASTSEAQASEKVTTVYVTVGKAGKPVLKTEPSPEGPVQAMLRRLGSLQRHKEQDSRNLKAKATEGVIKPPRKKLGARASMWEQEQGAPSATEVGVCKPIRRKQAALGSSEPAGETAASDAPKRPLSSILKSVPEAAPADPGSHQGAEGGGAGTGGVVSVGGAESNYLTVGPTGDVASLTEVIANEGAEPCYENIMIQPS